MNKILIVTLIALAVIMAALAYNARRCIAGDHTGPTIGHVMRIMGC